MKANELRIGNLVYARPYMEQVIDINIYHLIDILGGISEVEKEEIEYYPIPLTEEWLLKFGFKKKEHTYELGWFIVFFSEFSEYGLWLEDNEGGVINDKAMKYVHTLQNLYFALTGEELTIS